MPLDVIMPALGMAQDTGVIVAWHKQPGDAVSEGDVLFEVETDKATMEVEAQGSGYLSGVAAQAGEEVPVGQTIARIADSPDEAATAGPTADAAPAEGGDTGGSDTGADDLPEGHGVIMPTLGMAQDSGLLVGWLVEPGAKVGADDPLFEVETDKSTMEVPAGADGYLAAMLAEAGEDVPTGQVIAILTAEAPANTISRSSKAAPAPAAAKAADDKPADTPPAKPAGKASAQPKAPPKPQPGPQAAEGGRILASPKARRLAMEQGLDLQRLVTAGYPQPYHARDIETLKALPAETGPAAGGAAVAQALRLTAEIPHDGTGPLIDWAAKELGIKDPAAVLAGLVAGALPGDTAHVAHEAFGSTRTFTVAGGLGTVAEAETEDAAPDLILRDLRLTRVTGVTLGAEAAPVLTLTRGATGVTLTLECAPDAMAAAAAVALISDIAGRLEHPLRALL